MTYVLPQSLDIRATFTNNSSSILQTQYNNDENYNIMFYKLCKVNNTTNFSHYANIPKSDLLFILCQILFLMHNIWSSLQIFKVVIRYTYLHIYTYIEKYINNHPKNWTFCWWAVTLIIIRIKQDKTVIMKPVHRRFRKCQDLFSSQKWKK